MSVRLGSKPKRNIDRMRERSVKDQYDYADRHEAQNLERSKPGRPKTPGKIHLACVLLGLFIVAMLWGMWSFIEAAVLNVMAGSQGPVTTVPDELLSLGSFGMAKVATAGLTGALIGGIADRSLVRTMDAENLLLDHTDINTHTNDSQLTLIDDLVERRDLFPNAGAHSSVRPNTILSHVMLERKGLPKVDVPRRAEEDIRGADGELEYYKGEVLVDSKGQPLTDRLPIIDREKGDELFTDSGLPKDKALRRFFDSRQISYNPKNKDRTKLKGYNTLADLIAGDWELPHYEVARPSGAYVVDTNPVNTMVLAITRAGKGQTYIEPMIDMWTREKEPSNMVINDPKGELLVKFMVPATYRGYQVVQFNLINRIKTDIYNPLGMAADAAREGNFALCATYVENIADVFFPVEGADDPVWPTAANNAFKRAAYGMIDFYLEEERHMREEAARRNTPQEILDDRLDQLWGKVTLYNCYQLFVQLVSKRLKDPVEELEREAQDMLDEDKDPDNDPEFQARMADALTKQKIWAGEGEQDMLTLYFNATAELPENSMRRLVNNADNALKSMGKAEKMLASVYGIAITAMSFFTDPTISRLTSGRPSQNVDLGSLSFPRRIGVRFSAEFIKRNSLVGMQASWDCFSDEEFTEHMGPEFSHQDMVVSEGWARMAFKGIFPQDTAYIRLQLKDQQTGMLQRTFYFRFTKGYQMSLNGRYYVLNPVTDEKVVRDGVLVELQRTVEEREVEVVADDGEVSTQTEAVVRFVEGRQTFTQKRIEIAYEHDRQLGTEDIRMVEMPAISATQVRYCESPKAIFLVTPPHLTKYAKVILILIKQLVDLNFDKSYMTKENQAPLYRTRYMLDELGNLQSEGQGIANFATMLSIGLGQEQQFTLILQTLQQLRDVYGDSVDKIVQGNAQPLDSLIATPTGWKPMGELQVGDQVLVPAGGSAPVTGVFPRGEREVFEVARADGSSARACDEHLWQVEFELPDGWDQARLEALLAEAS